MLALSSAFEDIDKQAAAYRLVLLSFGRYEAALEALKGSEKRCKTDFARFSTLVVLAQVHSQYAEKHAYFKSQAYEHVSEALELYPPKIALFSIVRTRKLIQHALIIRAVVERDLKKHAEAVNSLEEAKQVFGQRTGELFGQMIRIVDEQGQHEELLKKVEIWGHIWLATCEESWEKVNERYQRAAKMSRKASIMLNAYENLTQNLDRRKWASPTRYQFALACRRTTADHEKAKQLLYKILDSDSCIDPVTGTESEETLLKTRTELSDIIFEQFRTVSTFKEKEDLLQEMQSVPNRRLGNIFFSSDSSGLRNLTLLARMYRKMGSLRKFQEDFETAFQTCVNALEDDNPWNDMYYLRTLFNILVCLSSLRGEAEVAYSAQFYVLTPKVLRAVRWLRPPTVLRDEDDETFTGGDDTDRRDRGEMEEGTQGSETHSKGEAISVAQTATQIES